MSEIPKVETPIYIIARNVKHDRYDGPDYWEDEFEPDYGYFLDPQAAEAFVNKVDHPAQARYEARMKAYNEATEREIEKAKEARRLGFNHIPEHYVMPEEPPYHEVIEVFPGRDVRA